MLDFDPAADKLDFGWFQPTNFDVTEDAGSTQIEIVNNNQTYTLNDVGLADMQTGNIIALDTNTKAKWTTLINGAEPQPEPQPEPEPQPDNDPQPETHTDKDTESDNQQEAETKRYQETNP